MQPTRNIHINPKFKQVHINPNFLSKSQNPTKTEVMVLKSAKPKNIHINPNFLPKPKPALVDGPILQMTRRKLVRQAVIPAKVVTATVPAPKLVSSTNNLIKIGRTKLIRIKPKTVNTVRKSIDRILVNNKYKLIRKPLVKNDQAKLGGIVKKYFICRPSVINKALISKKIIITDKKLLRIGTPVRKESSSLPSTYRNKKLEFLNINGVLYKSTNNKLEKSNSVKPISDATLKTNIGNTNLKQTSTVAKSLNTSRVLFVRGEKFLLESNGRSLKRLKESVSNGTNDSNKEFKRKRLDIGGLTYLAKSTGGEAVTFEQTNYHQTRYHLNLAKSKSINVLAKKYTKTNIPCSIFKRLGKCLSYERGRCPRLHDRKQVIICKRFLKGECEIEKCLLSHDINLSKMPTCRFYLQGCCTKQKCPYLHKKLNENVSICDEFLKGFCSLADKCPKRHELPPPSTIINKNKSHKTIQHDRQLCPWLEKQGSCLEKNCKFSHSKQVRQKDTHSTKPEAGTNCQSNDLMEDTNVRYFEQAKITVDSSDKVKIDSDRDCLIEIKEDFTTAKVLPSYIPF